MARKLESRVNTLYVYERLHECLDSEDIGYAVSRLFEELAYNFHVDTGVKAGHALGRDREPQNPTTDPYRTPKQKQREADIDRELEDLAEQYGDDE
jgi:hypothetical protein